MMTKFQSLLVLFALFAWSACDREDEPIPVYLEIAPFTVTTNPFSEGSASSNITEVWVTVAGEFLGVYDLPATVPVLAQGTASIKLEAGIRENGISATPNIYPFYEPFEVNREFVPGETITLSPSTRYVAEAKFALIEDFEDSSSRLFTELVVGDGAALVQSQDDSFEGAHVGQLSIVRATRPVVEIVTTTSYSDLQQSGSFVYLEMDYKAEAPVAWGIYNFDGSETRLHGPGFLPKAEWNKIYLNLSQLIFDSQLDQYQISLQGLNLDLELPDSANVFLDNIKLLHF